MLRSFTQALARLGFRILHPALSKRSLGHDESIEESTLIVGYRVDNSTNWTNRSVLRLANGKNPVTAVLQRAHDVVNDAVDAGWIGPPYDPFELADLLSIRVVPTSEVRDARIVAASSGYVIELNPNRPRVRQRFSVAHEIAHTLFPDCAEAIRNRALHAESDESDWELEALCNIAASEFLMPAGSMPESRRDGTIDEALALRNTYDISAEAVMIRTIQLTQLPLAVFSATRLERGRFKGRYRLDYAIEARTWNGEDLAAGSLLPEESPVRFCNGIGYTQKGVARFGAPDAWLECIGVRGYPGNVYPRVVGYLSRPNNITRREITYLWGDAVEPSYDGMRIVAFLTNDVTPNWGGGFARQVSARHSEIQIAFRNAVKKDRRVLGLGNVELIRANDTLYYAPLVAQSGIGRSHEPRIRYSALEHAFQSLAAHAARLGASIHMPRIGGGVSGGSWDVVKELIEEFLVPLAEVRVYDLPKTRTRTS